MKRRELIQEWLWRTKVLDKTKGDRLLTIKDYADLIFIFERVEKDILNKCKKVIESYEYIDSEDVLCLNNKIDEGIKALQEVKNKLDKKSKELRK